MFGKIRKHLNDHVYIIKDETSMTKDFDTQENDYFNFSFAPLHLCGEKIR
jgi:hypothetical protein